MSADLLTFPSDDQDVAIEPETEPTIALEPDAEIAIEPETDPQPIAHVVSTALVELLPADFKLPLLTKFIPNTALRIAVDQGAVAALAIVVQGNEGLTRADAALAVLRGQLRAVEDHLEEPIGIANALHKRLTTVRTEWLATGKAALDTVGRRIFAEQRRLDGLAAEERRRQQAEADRLAREAAQREADAAAKADVPAPVVEELQRQAETATAPPVSMPASAPAPLKNSSTVTTWKARLVGTPGSDEPNPGVADLTVLQRARVLELLHAVIDGKAPLAVVAIDWGYLNKRAKADKSALAIAGIEAFEEGSVRAKGTRRS